MANENARELFQAIVRSVKNVQKTDEKDYINDNGLLTCGICNTPRLSRVTLSQFGSVIVPVACKCMNDEYNALVEKKRVEDCERARNTYIEFEKCRKYRFEQDDGRTAQITKAIRKYAEKFEVMLEKNIGLVLYGDVGTGKTFYAGCVANELIDRGYSVVMTSLARIIEYTDAFSKNRQRKEEYEEHLYKSHLLILDDLATEREGKSTDEKVYNILNMRYSSGKPILITTNLTQNEIKSPSTIERRRIYDRLIEVCQLIEIPGKSRRIEASNKRHDVLNKYLGLAE